MGHRKRDSRKTKEGNQVAPSVTRSNLKLSGTDPRWGRICDEDRSAMRADPWWGRSCDQDRSVTRTDPKQISGWRIRWCQRLPCFFYTFWNNSKYINAWVESIKIIILLFYIQYSLSCLVFSQHVMHFNNNSFYKGCWCWLSLSQNLSHEVLSQQGKESSERLT